MSQFDLTVIGSGPGGYVCAVKAAQLGMKVAIVEKRSTFGGTCLNIGCIPSKALLHASEMFHEAEHGFDELGIKVSPKLDLKAMHGHKDAVVKSNVDGIEFLFKKNKITPFVGTGSIKEAGTVVVTDEKGGSQEISTKNIVIATGSDVAGIPGVEFEFDEKIIVSSTGALDLPKVPKELVVIGGGVIGLELGSVWKRLGANVTVVEYLGKILGPMDNDVSKNFQRMLKKQGFNFKLSSKVTAIEKTKSGATVTFEPANGGGSGEAGKASDGGAKNGGDSVQIDADVVLVSTGRLPYTQGLGLEALGVEMDGRKIKTNQQWQTNIAGIYAIGDVIDGPMLAHKAEDEGVAVAEMLSGQHPHINYDIIPGVVYTSPEVASVGKSEEELKAAGIAYNVGKFPFSANGRARAMNQSEGFVKILADKETDRILGGHIVGFGAGEMIHEVAVIMEFGGSSEDLGRICHAHPTMSEAVKEAGLATFSKPIHM